MTTNPNDPISPNPLSEEQVFYGLTKREYFAARLMAALYTQEAITNFIPKVAAEWAVTGADDLIAELNSRTVK